MTDLEKQTITYKNYINKHKINIMKAFEEVTHNSLFIERYNNKILNKLKDRAIHHDDSKLSNEEFIFYRKHYFPIDKEEKKENEENFKKVWEHHKMNNSHHWQYRQNKKFFNEQNEEEILDILENILDWIAMGYQFGNRPYEYYEKNKNKIILCKKEKEYLEDLIYNIIDIKFIEERKEKNGK